jgi:hypothetical protein
MRGGEHVVEVSASPPLVFQASAFPVQAIEIFLMSDTVPSALNVKAISIKFVIIEPVECSGCPIFFRTASLSANQRANSDGDCAGCWRRFKISIRITVPISNRSHGKWHVENNGQAADDSDGGGHKRHEPSGTVSQHGPNDEDHQKDSNRNLPSVWLSAGTISRCNVPVCIVPALRSPQAQTVSIPT